MSKLPWRLAHAEALTVDDRAMAPLGEAERRDFLEIRGERGQTCSARLTSQLPAPSK